MKCILILLCLVTCSLGYSILCIFPAPSRSGDILAKGVVMPLLKAGHQITWATPFEQKDILDNLKIINLVETRALLDARDPSDPTPKSLSEARNFARNVTMLVGQNQALRTVLLKEQFDAVITMWFMNDNDAGYAAIQQVPWILLSSIGYHTHLEWLVDEVRSVSTTPLVFYDADIPLSFWNRLFNLVVQMAINVDWWFDQYRLDKLYQSMFADLAAARGVTLPSFYEVQKNVSILLINSHESIATAASKPPNAINIAGYHINEVPIPLPNDLQEIMDNSPQGVVYFSMGSILRSANIMQGETVSGLLQTFAALKQTVLWKFEEALDVELPKNVHVKPWMPQQSILAHPNTRVFITHGGQLSTLEAVSAGVPLLAIPVFGDQPSNAERARRLGYALKVDFGPGMVEEVGQKLEILLTNQSYYKRAKYLSFIFNARPESPSKLISHYVELAIETKGAYHLRSPSNQYSWLQLRMLDLILVLLAAIVTILLIFRFVIRICSSLLCGRSRKAEKKQKSY